ncbi:hypothetical protein ACFV24_32380 [Nocardia fluminea]|uniref:hypothetical protein n=1 Tax=Nocardia fluminea TaxID=134984 RepID=UPI00366D8C58
MVSTGEPSNWAAGEFGEGALETAKCLVRGLKRGQRSARAVQATARAQGSTDNRVFGAMWNTRYQVVVDDFGLADLPGFETIKPKGASYSLAVVNGRVLIPFRHSTSMTKPIGQAKLASLVPRRIARDTGVEPAPTLFDAARNTDSHPDDASDSPTVRDVAADARASNLKVVYVAYVANADSDDILAAWWGTPTSLEDDGTMVWFPERLDLSIADGDFLANPGKTDLHATGTASETPGFAHGDEPDLTVLPKPRIDELPASEIEPGPPAAAAEDDE